MNNKCLKCGKLKNINDFYQYNKPNRKNTYFVSHCKECSGGKEIRSRNKKSKHKLKLAVIKHYGNKCKCCGEDNVLFLSVDHVNNDGHKMKRSDRQNINQWIKKNNYPKTLQILCYNCNLGKAHNNGVCPHKV